MDCSAEQFNNSHLSDSFCCLPTIVTLKEQVAVFPKESEALHVTFVTPNGKTSWELWEQTTPGELSTLSHTRGCMLIFVDIELPTSVLYMMSVQFKTGAWESEKGLWLKRRQCLKSSIDYVTHYSLYNHTRNVWRYSLMVFHIRFSYAQHFVSLCFIV